MISKSRMARWTEMTTDLNYSPGIRQLMGATNAIESVNRSLPKVAGKRLTFPKIDAATNLCFMTIRVSQSKRWRMATQHWSQALNYLGIESDGPGTSLNGSTWKS